MPSTIRLSDQFAKVQLVPANYTYGLVPSQDQLLVMIRAFKYRNENWPEKALTDFIGTDFERLSTMFDAIGIELTAAVRPPH